MYEDRRCTKIYTVSSFFERGAVLEIAIIIILDNHYLYSICIMVNVW